MVVTPRTCTTRPCTEGDEQWVEASKEDRVDVEEVGGHDALGLGGEELSPRWALSSGSRWKTMAASHGRHARLRHRDTELVQLNDDAEIAPPGILLCLAADQLQGSWGKPWTTWSAVRVGPPLADERAMPAEDRLRRNEEPSPAFLGYETGDHADQRSIGPGELGRATWRRSTASWWQSTRISASFAAASDQRTRTVSRARRDKR